MTDRPIELSEDEYLAMLHETLSQMTYQVAALRFLVGYLSARVIDKDPSFFEDMTAQAARIFAANDERADGVHMALVELIADARNAAGG